MASMSFRKSYCKKWLNIRRTLENIKMVSLYSKEYNHSTSKLNGYMFISRKI